MKKKINIAIAGFGNNDTEIDPFSTMLTGGVTVTVTVSVSVLVPQLSVTVRVIV